MKKNYLFEKILITAMLFVGVQLRAQVTIGSNEKPESFEVLKIDSSSGTKGLRLTRHSNQDLQDLATAFLTSSDPKAEGLMIYNTDTDQVVYWDGVEWRKLIYGNEFLNGIHIDVNGINGQMKLGGDLVEDTTINHKGYELAITTGSGGKLFFNKDHFTLINNTLQMGSSAEPIDIKVSDGLEILGNGRNIVVLNSKGDGVNMVTSALNPPDSIALMVKTDTTTVTGIFHHNVDISSLDATKPIILSASDTKGRGQWVNLTNTIESKTIGLQEITTGWTANYWYDTSDRFKLNVGKWFILGRFRSTIRTATTTSNYLTRLRIMNTSKNKVVYSSGDIPERKGASSTEGGGSFAAPNIMAFLSVDDSDDEYVVQIYSLKPNTVTPTSSPWIGDSYLRAVQLSKNTN